MHTLSNQVRDTLKAHTPNPDAANLAIRQLQQDERLLPITVPYPMGEKWRSIIKESHAGRVTLGHMIGMGEGSGGAPRFAIDASQGSVAILGEAKSGKSTIIEHIMRVIGADAEHGTRGVLIEMLHTSFLGFDDISEITLDDYNEDHSIASVLEDIDDKFATGQGRSPRLYHGSHLSVFSDADPDPFTWVFIDDLDELLDATQERQRILGAVASLMFLAENPDQKLAVIWSSRRTTGHIKPLLLNTRTRILLGRQVGADTVQTVLPELTTIEALILSSTLFLFEVSRPGRAVCLKSAAATGALCAFQAFAPGPDLSEDHAHTHGPQSYTYTGANGHGFYVAVCGICGHKAEPEDQGW